eukprot:1928932-Amphidinium_carterae.2
MWHLVALVDHCGSDDVALSLRADRSSRITAGEKERERYEKQCVAQQAKHMYEWVQKRQHEQERFKERMHREARGLYVSTWLRREQECITIADEPIMIQSEDWRKR